MSKRSQPAACACGQVLFETAERKAGDELSCPWCERKYRYLGDDKIEPWSSDGKPSAKDSEEEDDEADQPAEKPAGEEPPKKKKKKKKKKPESARSEAAPARDEKQETHKEIREPEKGGVGMAVVRIPAATDSIEKKKPATSDGESRRANVSVRSKQPKEIPGGLFPMIGFIIGFNALALLLLQYVVYKVPGGGGERETLWGSAVPKTAIWPELAALLIGHVVGFFAWSWYVYELQKLKANTEKAQQ